MNLRLNLLIFMVFFGCYANAFDASRLEKQGFKCGLFENQYAVTCVGMLGKAYPEKVAFIIPIKNSKHDLILHLIGNQTAEVDFEKDVLAKFRFDQLLEKSGRSEVLIVPGNRGPRLTYRDEFMCHPKTIREKSLKGAALMDCKARGEAGFNRFMDAAMDALFRAKVVAGKKPRKIALAGHSGAFAPMAAILENPRYKSKVNEVYCFDCMYGDEEVFIRYAKSCPPRRLVTVALRGERTDLGNFRIWGSRHGSEVAPLVAKKAEELRKIKSQSDPDERQKHLNEFDSDILKKTAFEADSSKDASDLCKSKLSILVAKGPDHDGTVAAYFPSFLKKCGSK